jgi:hypothetical protein
MNFLGRTVDHSSFKDDFDNITLDGEGPGKPSPSML